MIAENQIRETLVSYLLGKISLDEFEDWLVERSWNMHQDSEEAAQKLAAAIELRLAEHSSGHLSHADLRNELLPFVTSYVPNLFVNWASPSPIYASQNSIIQMGAPFALAWPVDESALRELSSR